MKKLLIIIGIIFGILIASILVLPMVFKDDIQKALDDTMDDSLNASVFYNPDKFDISLISNFPNLTVSLGDFGVVGIEEFSQDTLASISSFEVSVDLMSVIGGDQIKVNEILLFEPKIYVLVLEDGTANYDIAKASEETDLEDEPEEGSSEISIGIERWAITDGELVFSDQSLSFYTALNGLNHEGTGNFTLDIFDLTTRTTVDAVSLGFEGVDYVSNKQLKADVTLNMNLSEMLFTFKENRIALNEFAISADGFISMPEEDIDMDISFGGNEIDLKSILSLIPGVYQEYLSGVSASGEINFDGLVKGTFNETSMPKIAANLSVSDGAISYAEFNVPMEAINIQSSFDYPSADLSETSFNVDKFSMLVDGEQLEAYLKFKNLDNYTWDFGFDGSADLEKITKIVPIEGMTLRGKINAGLTSAGQMSTVEAEQYNQLPTSGKLSINGFYFESEDLPQGFGISAANLSFNPSQISLTQFDATSGSSDFSLQGNISNYLGFALNDEILLGSLSLSSQLLDLNEFIPEETEEVETVEDTSSLEVIRVPENIDFTFASSIGKIAFTSLEMNNFEGKVLIKDGAVLLDQNRFNMLDGIFELTGSYVTKDLEEPKYDFGFKVKDLSIAGAFESFSTIQKYVPIAKQVTGKFSTDFNVNGLIGSDMMPLMDEINLAGLVNVAQASLTKGDFVSKLNNVASFNSGAASNNSSEPISIKDVLIQTSIKDGHLFVEPFNLNVNGQKATLGGSNTLDGKLDYSMLIKEIPTGVVGTALNSAIGSLAGGQKLVSDKIDVDLGIGGTYDDVAVKLLSTSASGVAGGAAAAFKQQITSKVDDEKAKAEAELERKKEEQRQKIIAEAQTRAEQIRSEGKAGAEKVKQEGYAAADKLVSDAGSNPIKKKVAQEAAKKLRSESDKKAAAIESEANNKADQLIADANEKAAKI